MYAVQINEIGDARYNLDLSNDLINYVILLFMEKDVHKFDIHEFIDLRAIPNEYLDRFILNGPNKVYMIDIAADSVITKVAEKMNVVCYVPLLQESSSLFNIDLPNLNLVLFNLSEDIQSIRTSISLVKAVLNSHSREAAIKLINYSTPEGLQRWVFTGRSGRKVLWEHGSFLDYTPYCVYTNWVCDDIFTHIPIKDAMLYLVKQYGTEVTYDEFSRALTDYIKKKDDELRALPNYKFFTSRNWIMRKNVACVLLPLRHYSVDNKSNNTGVDWLVFGTELSDRFIRHLLYYLLKNAKSELERTQYLQVATRYDLTVESNLIVSYNQDYKIKWDDVLEACFEMSKPAVRSYFDCIETNALSMYDQDPDNWTVRMNVDRSPGLDNIQSDGTVFNKKENYELPNVLFDSDDLTKNAYAEVCYYSIKNQKVQSNEFIYKKVNRLIGLTEGRMFDVEWQYERLLAGEAYIQSVNNRINGGDPLLYVKDVDFSEPVWKVDLESLFKQPDYLNFILYGDLSYLQGKAREHVYQKSTHSFSYVNISPFQFQQYVLSLQKYDFSYLDNMISVTGSANRLRNIYPGFFSLNLADACYIKMYSYALEHCKIGFPNVDPSSEWYLYTSSIINKFKYKKSFCSDTRHFETFFSSNPKLLTLIGDVRGRRYMNYRDMGMGFMTSPLGLLGHDFITGSGKTATTLDNMVGGKASQVWVLARLDIDPPKATRRMYDWIYAHAYFFLRGKYNIKKSEYFEAIDISELPYVDTKYGRIYLLLLNGTDDEICYLLSDTVTREQMIELLNDPKIKEVAANLSCNIELEPGAHFGVQVLDDGMLPNLFGNAQKCLSLEKRNFGDRICAAYCEMFKENPLMEAAWQYALDSINGGSTKAYRLGAQWTTIVLNTFPEYTADVLDKMNVQYSPTAKLISASLVRSGYNPSASKKLPHDKQRAMLAIYLYYLQNGIHSVSEIEHLL